MSKGTQRCNEGPCNCTALGALVHVTPDTPLFVAMKGRAIARPWARNANQVPKPAVGCNEGPCNCTALGRPGADTRRMNRICNEGPCNCTALGSAPAS